MGIVRVLQGIILSKVSREALLYREEYTIVWKMSLEHDKGAMETEELT